MPIGVLNKLAGLSRDNTVFLALEFGLFLYLGGIHRSRRLNACLARYARFATNEFSIDGLVSLSLYVDGSMLHLLLSV